MGLFQFESVERDNFFDMKVLIFYKPSLGVI